MPTNKNTPSNLELFPDSSLDRKNTIESNTFTSREVLTGSDVLRLKTGDVAAKVSSVVDSMITTIKDVADAPGNMRPNWKRNGTKVCMTITMIGLEEVSHL